MSEPMPEAPREYRRPQVVRDPALPERVTVYEVGPRDGLGLPPKSNKFDGY